MTKRPEWQRLAHLKYGFGWQTRLAKDLGLSLRTIVNWVTKGVPKSRKMFIELIERDLTNEVKTD